jgi:hypothetical protein
MSSALYGMAIQKGLDTLWGSQIAQEFELWGQDDLLIFPA